MECFKSIQIQWLETGENNNWNYTHLFKHPFVVHVYYILLSRDNDEKSDQISVLTALFCMYMKESWFGIKTQ